MVTPARRKDEIEGELSEREAACSPMERRFVHWLMNLPRSMDSVYGRHGLQAMARTVLRMSSIRSYRTCLPGSASSI
jgi:hypothetical protein